MNTISIILVNPQMGENIGMCARAMLNCGLTDLRIVNPRDGWPNERADAASSGALEKGVTAKVFETLQQASADLQVTYATTNRLRDLVKDVYTARAAASEVKQQNALGHKVGIVFGPERTGLVNEDIAACTKVISIPLNPDFSSLNLAQAVLVVGYELFTAQSAAPDSFRDLGDTNPATLDEVEGVIKRFETEMEAGDFFRAPDLRPTLMRNFRSFINRGQPTAQEISTLHGVLTALKRAANKGNDKV